MFLLIFIPVLVYVLLKYFKLKNVFVNAITLVTGVIVGLIIDDDIGGHAHVPFSDVFGLLFSVIVSCFTIIVGYAISFLYNRFNK